MSNDIDSRINSIVQKKAAIDAEQSQRDLSAKQQAAELAKLAADAPALWAERWKLFQECARQINDKLALADIRVGASEVNKHVGNNEIAHFQITVDVDGAKLEYVLECAVQRQGDISVRRRLPGLVDAIYIKTDTIDANAINNLLLDFVENVALSRK